MRGHPIVQSVLASLIVPVLVPGGSAAAAAPVVKASPAIYRESEDPATIDEAGVRYFASYGPYYSYPPGYVPYGYGYAYRYRPRPRARFYRPYRYRYRMYSYGVPVLPGYYVSGYRVVPYRYAPPVYYRYAPPGYGWYGGVYFGGW